MVEKIKILNKLYPITKFVKVDKNNKNIKCPFHKDDKPSAKVYNDTNSLWCFRCHRFFYIANFIYLFKLNEGKLYNELQEMYKGQDLEKLCQFDEIEKKVKEEKESPKSNDSFNIIDYTNKYFNKT
jgi:hypothetical protein